MAQRIGLSAVVDLADFNKGLSLYLTGIDRMYLSTNKIVQDLTNDFALLGKVTAGFGASLALGAFGASVGAVNQYIDFTAEAVRQSAELEQGIANVGAVLGLANEELIPLKDTALELGLSPRLKVDAFEAADAMLILAKNGLVATDIIDGAAEASIALANATGGEFQTSADIVTDALKIFKIEATEVERVVDQVTGVINNSKFDMQDYFLALANSAAIFESVGGSFEDLNTTIALISSAFNSGRRAGTGFSQFIIRLPGITDKAREHMLKLGIITQEAFENGQTVSEEFAAQLAGLEGSYFSVLQQIRDYQAGVIGAAMSEQQRASAIAALQVEASSLESQLQPLYDQLAQLSEQMDTTGNKFFDAEGNFLGMENAAQVLKDALGGLSDEARALAIKDIFGIDALEVVVRLMEEGSVGWQEFEQAVGSVDGFEIAASRMNTLLGSLEILEGQIEALNVLIGDKFNKGAKRFVDTITDLLFINTDRIADAWNPVEEAFDNLVDQLIPLVRQYFPDFITLIERFNRVIALGIDWIAKMAVRYLPQLIDVGMVMAEWIENIIVEGTLFNSTFGELPAIVQNVLVGFKQFVNITKSIIRWIKDFVDGIREILTPLREWLGRTITITDVFLALGAAIAFAFLPIALLISKMITIATVTAAVISVIRNQYMDEFVGVFEFAKDIIYDFVQTFVDVFNALRRGDFAGAWDEILGFGKRTWDKVYIVVKRVIDRIMNLIENINWVEIWNRLLATVIDFARDVVNYVANDIDWAKVWRIVSNAAIDAFNFVVEWLKTNIDWEGIWNTIVDFAKKKWDELVQFIRDIDWKAIWQLVLTGVKNALSRAIGFIRSINWKAIWGRIWDFLLDGAREVWERIKTFFQGVDWGALWDRIKNQAIEAWGVFVDWFRREFPQTAAVIEEVWRRMQPVLEFIKEAWIVIRDWFKENMPWIWELIKETWTKVANWVRQNMPWITQMIKDAWASVRRWFQEEWPKVVDWFKMVWEKFKPLIGLMKQAVTGDLLGAWEGLKNWFAEEFPKTAEILGIVWAEMKPWVDMIALLAKGDIQGAWQGFKDWFAEKFPETTATLIRVYGEWKPWIDILKDLATGDLQGAWAGFSTWFAEEFPKTTAIILATYEAWKVPIDLMKGLITGDESLQSAWAEFKIWFAEEFPMTNEILSNYLAGSKLLIEAFNLLLDGEFRLAWLTYKKAIATAMGESTVAIDQELNAQEKSLFEEQGARIRSWFETHFPQSTAETVSATGRIGTAWNTMITTFSEKQPILDAIAAFLIEEMTVNILATLLAAEAIVHFLTGDWEGGWAKAKEAMTVFWSSDARLGLSEWFGTTFPLAVFIATEMIKEIEERFITLKTNFKLLLEDIERDWETWRQLIDLSLALIIGAVGVMVILTIAALDELIKFLRGESESAWLIWAGIGVLAVTAIAVAFGSLAAISPLTWAIIAGAALVGLGLLWDEVEGVLSGPLQKLGDWFSSKFPRTSLAFLDAIEGTVTALYILGRQLLIPIALVLELDRRIRDFLNMEGDGFVGWIWNTIGPLGLLDMGLSNIMSTFTAVSRFITGTAKAFQALSKDIQAADKALKGDFIGAMELVRESSELMKESRSDIAEGATFALAPGFGGIIEGGRDFLNNVIEFSRQFREGIGQALGEGPGSGLFSEYMTSAQIIEDTFMQILGVQTSSTEQMKADITDKFSAIRDQVNSSFSPESPESMVNAIGQGFEISKSKTKLGINDIYGMISEWVGMDQQKTAEMGENYANLGGNVIEEYKSTFGSSWPTALFMVQDFISAAGTELDPMGDTFAESGIKSMEDLAKAISDKTGVPLSQVQGLLDQTKFTMEDGLGISGGNSSLFEGFGSGMMGGLDTGISSNAGPIFDTSSGILNDMKQTFGDSLGTIETEGVKKFEGLKIGSTSEVEGMKTGSNNLVTTFMGELGTKWEEIRAEAVKKFNETKAGSVSEVTGLKDESTSLVGDLKKQATDLVTGLKTDAVDLFGGMKTESTEEVTGLKDESLETIGTFKTDAVDTFKEMGVESIDTVKDMKDMIITVFEVLQGGVVNKVRDTKVSVITEIEDMHRLGETELRAFEGTILTIMGNIETETKSIFDRIVQYVTQKMQELINNVATTFSVDNFVQLGKDIVGGFIQGINDRIGEAASKVAELVGLSQQAGESEAGAQSPATEFMPLGSDIISGVAFGMERQTHEMINVLTNAIGHMSDINARSMMLMHQQTDEFTQKLFQVSMLQSQLLSAMSGDLQAFNQNIQSSVLAARQLQEQVNTVPITSSVPVGAGYYNSQSTSMENNFNVYNQLDEAELYYRVRKIVQKELGA